MNPFLRFLSSAVASAAIALFGASIFIFASLHFVPGGYAGLVLPVNATAESVAAFNQQFGVNEPLPEQYVKWLGSVVRGDLGTSLTSKQPVQNEIASHAPITAELALLATLFSVLFGVPLGAVAGIRSDRRLTPILTRGASSLALAVPNFVVATAVVYLAAVNFLGLSIGLYVPLTDDPLGNLDAVLLPSIILGVFPAGLIARTTRDSVLGVLTQPYITAAVARGETPLQIFWRHVLRNAINPVVTLAAVNIGYLLGGAVIIENIFSIPGLGKYALEAIQVRDYPQVEGVVIVGTFAFIVMNLLADIAYAAIDPRISLAGRRA